MTSIILFANDANASISGPITNTATSVTLQTGQGALFPSPGAGQIYVATFTDAATGLIKEIVHVTAMSGDTATIVRAQEGTVALAWSSGDLFDNLMSAGTAAAFAQSISVPPGAAYAPDTGTANAYAIAPSPTPSSFAAGLQYSFLAAHANSGASTLAVAGVGGTFAIVRRDSTALQTGDIPVDSICLVEFDGTNWQLISASVPSFPGTISTNGYYQLPNGYVRQWGTITGLTLNGEGVTVNVTFPEAFPTACFGASMQAVNPTSANNVIAALQPTGTPSTTTATFTTVGYNSAGITTLTSVMWEAWGH